MIITEFYDGQGLGNQLWVYVATRTIAKKLNIPFLILAPERFKGRDFLDIAYGEVETTDEVVKMIAENKLNIFKETMYLDLDLDCFSIDYDAAVLNLKPYTKIDGYFQSEKYFFGDLEYFKTLLPIKHNWLDKKQIEDDQCVLNIRGGEYKGVSTLILPKSYWVDAMNNMIKRFPNIKEFVIVTDDAEYASRLFPEIGQVERGVAQSYLALHQAKYLIVSNSSFSYFPIKTQQNKSFVIAPLHWARFNNPYKRWSSPANLYTDWFWQDSNGVLHTYEESVDGYLQTMQYYEDNYNVRTSYEVYGKFHKPFTFKKYIPKPIKTFVKKMIFGYTKHQR